MRLLALYIKHYRDFFEDVCFNFTSEYEVTYKSNVLSIEKKENVLKEFYGKMISDISVIIGKNGTGKSSILNLIGYTMDERLRNLEYDNDTDKYLDRYFLVFLAAPGVYYLEFIGNDFVFENTLITFNDEISKCTCIKKSEKANYNYEEVNYIEVLKDNEYYCDDNFNDRIIYINSTNRSLYKSEIQPLSGVKTWLIPRNWNDDISLKRWYQTYLALCSDKVIDSHKVHLKFIQSNYDSKHPSYMNMNAENSEDDVTRLIGSIMHIKESFRDCVCNNLNKTISFIIYSLRMFYNDCNEFAGNIYEFLDKWKFIFELSRISELFNDLKSCFVNIDISYDSLKIRKYFIEAIEHYEKLYVSISNLKDEIIPAIDDFELVLDGKYENKKITQFLECVDEINGFFHTFFSEDNFENSYDKKIGHEKYSIKKTNVEVIPLVSQGEKNLITLFSVIGQEMKKNVDAMGFYTKSNFLFLIDEVETGMHIEWSRNFISQLINTVESLPEYLLPGGNNEDDYEFKKKLKTYLLDNFKIQYIMTTHSPFLVSDLLHNSVIELERVDGSSCVIQRANKYMFAQNIQTLISDDFFMKSFCGQHAVKTICSVIDVLNDENKPVSDEDKEKMTCLVNEIGEPILRNKLKQMLRRKFET